jgi:hypothetical protein
MKLLWDEPVQNMYRENNQLAIHASVECMIINFYKYTKYEAYTITCSEGSQ